MFFFTVVLCVVHYVYDNSLNSVALLANSESYFRAWSFTLDFPCEVHSMTCDQQAGLSM